MKVSWLQDQLPRLAAHLESSAEELNGLDAQLGDGDLGVTMVRGSRQLLEIREELPDDWGMALLKWGVSCIPAALAVWALVKPRVFAAYLGLAVTGAIISGMVWQAIA